MNMGTSRNQAVEEEPKTLSLLGGVAGGATPLTEAELMESSGGGSSKNKRLGQTAMLVGGLLAVVCGALYGVRLAQGDLATQGAKEAESKIENFVAKRSQKKNLATDDPYRAENIESLFQDADAVVAMFAGNVAERQVPLEYVKKNPFELATKPKVEGPAPIDDSEMAVQKRLKELTAELAKHKLYSIMRGPRNVAVIDGDFYQERQKLGSFVVSKIEPLAVTLTAEGRTFQLTIDTDGKP